MIDGQQAAQGQAIKAGEAAEAAAASIFPRC